MFNFIKSKLSKIYSSVTSSLQTLFALHSVDEQTLKTLERILIEADTGVHTTKKIITALRDKMKAGSLKTGQDLKEALEIKLTSLLSGHTDQVDPSVYLLVGINGSGKTTFASKLAHMHKDKKVLLVAGDTFRAAATEQLQEWAKRTGTDIIVGEANQDPASLIFKACEKFKNESYDLLIIDTAGRLQTKVNLMKELEKIKKVVAKQLPEEKIQTLLTVDAMLGQNSFAQAQTFHEATQLGGIVLTKMDGTGKGGIVISICQEFGIPIQFISFGESVEQAKAFNAQEFVQGLLES